MSTITTITITIIIISSIITITITITNDISLVIAVGGVAVLRALLAVALLERGGLGLPVLLAVLLALLVPLLYNNCSIYDDMLLYSN